METPSLSYLQLFSFQVLYTSSRSEYRNLQEKSKKGEWQYGILEVDFPKETLFLQDRDRIFLSQTFASFNKHVKTNSSEDCSLSLIFNTDQWEIAAQNIAEKACLQHLLECIVKSASIDYVVQSGKEKGIVGLDKCIIKHGKVQRKVIKRLDERYLLLCPGKLFIFKNLDIRGKHVRYVTSMLGATIQMLSEEQEFQILAPGSKTITLISQNQEDLTSWVEALAISIDYTKQIAEASKLMKKEKEKQSNSQSSKEQMLQRTSGMAGQCVTFPQLMNKMEAVGSRTDLKADPASLNSPAKKKAGYNAYKSHHEVQLYLQKPKQLFRQDDKENRDTRLPCSGRDSSIKPSRAMKYLENALDEMEIIVGSIKTTRKITGSGLFDISENRKNKTEGNALLRSSWDFIWKTKGEQRKNTYSERRRREKELPMSPSQGTKTRGYNEVVAAWKQPTQRNKISDNKIRDFEFCSQIRHSLDSTDILSRIRDLPNCVNFQQDKTRQQKTCPRNALPNAMKTSTSSGGPLKVDLTPASQNLLKRHSNELLVAEANTLGRHLQTAADGGVVSCETNQPTQFQQQNLTERDADPYFGTASSTSEDEEDEEEDDANVYGEGVNDCEDGEVAPSSRMPSAFRLGSSNGSRDSGLQDGHSSVLDSVHGSELYGQCTQPPMDLPFSRGGCSTEPKGSGISIQRTQNQQIDPSTQHRSRQVWQEVSNRTSAHQQSSELNSIKQRYGGSDASFEKTRYSEKSDVLLEPTTPKQLQSNQNMFASCVEADDSNTLPDPVYDPDFTGPQIIHRRPSKLTQHDLPLHWSAGPRCVFKNEGTHHSSKNTHQLPNVSEAAGTQYTHGCENENLSNVYGDQRTSMYGGQEGAEVLAQDSLSFRSAYKRQQEIELARHFEISESSSSQQRCSQPDHGLVHANELPELVNRISKITSAIDGKYQQGYDWAHGGAADSDDRGTSAYYGGQQETVRDPYQQAVRGPSQPKSGLVPSENSALTSQASSLVRGSRHSGVDHVSFHGADEHMKWSSVQTSTALKDPRYGSQRQSIVEDQSAALVENLGSSLSASERRL